MLGIGEERGRDGRSSRKKVTEAEIREQEQVHSMIVKRQKLNEK